MRGYRYALQWLVDNDDCHYLDDPEDTGLSVTASMVADIYEKPDDKVREDIKRLRGKQGSM